VSSIPFTAADVRSASDQIEGAERKGKKKKALSVTFFALLRKGRGSQGRRPSRIGRKKREEPSTSYLKKEKKGTADGVRLGKKKTWMQEP